MFESDGEMEVEELVSSLGRCKIDFGRFLLTTHTPLHVDVQVESIPSPSGTETPPLSPGIVPFIF